MLGSNSNQSSYREFELGAILFIPQTHTQFLQVTVPFEGLGNFEVSFDLLVGPGIIGAARELCYHNADKLGMTTDAEITSKCLPIVEEYIIAVLLANKIVERKVQPKVVKVSVFYHLCHSASHDIATVDHSS